MGNNHSRPHGSSPISSTPATSTSNSSTTSTRREPKRRESLQSLPSGKATAAPPSETLESATAHQTSTTTSSAIQRHQLPTQSQPRSRTNELSSVPDQDLVEFNISKDHSRQQDEDSTARPVRVPSRIDRSRTNLQAAPTDLHHIPPSQTQRPPRLPLPIGEEIHTPGSPIISPADLSSALDRDSIEGVLPRRSSVLSSTTIDEDELGDEEHAYIVEGEVRKTIPTMVEWKSQGERVYVTGTFAGWNRKYRLHKNSDSKDGLSAVIALPPGTHHLKFLVDGEMRTSDHLPTAVDDANILVNYLEVNADDMPPPSKPMDIAQPAERPQHPPPGVYPPQVLPPTPDIRPAPHADTSTVAAGAGTGTESDGTKSAAATARQPEVTSPPKQHGTVIPPYLTDLDQAEDSPSYQRAAAAISTLSPPPSLPLFMSRSILNGTTPLKDDASVLSMPNHTVLNHLATSSIKDNVLATSGTTRFKRKYITTILYKPTSDDRD
ncbi:MAG: hypothetical protein M1825_000013 [Sarcosagium campestre]|nr:MAG: hypothetical protein M1825_000013 [Sarcosagium campestre]